MDVITIIAINQDNQPIGFAGLENTGRITSLYVLAAQMRQGIGSALLNKLFFIAQAKKYTN